ncbi:MAG: hypothetical protein ACRCX2_05730 [Paraclostridium sp.]
MKTYHQIALEQEQKKTKKVPKWNKKAPKTQIWNRIGTKMEQKGTELEQKGTKMEQRGTKQQDQYDYKLRSIFFKIADIKGDISVRQEKHYFTR